MPKVFIILIVTLFSATLTAQEPVNEITPPVVPDPLALEIREWTVPWPDTRPRDPDVAPNGSIWLVGQGGDYVAHFDPRSQEFSRFDLPPGTGPHNVIVDRDASLWIAGNRLGFIGRMDPNTGQMARFTMPDESVKDPHTLVFSGRDTIWFTAQWSNFIGRMNKRNGAIEGVHLPLDRARPYGIRLDSNGRPWVALLGTNALATVDPETLELEIYRTPRAETRPRRIAITSDDAVWYTDYDQGFLGRLEPQTGAFTEWKNPSPGSGPYAIAADNQDRIWLVETWPDKNVFAGFDPVSEMFFSLTEVPSGAGAVRHMVFDAGTNSIWFGTDTNNLGQALLPPPGVPGLPPAGEAQEETPEE